MKKIFAVLVSLFLITTLAGPSLADNTLEKVKKKGTLVAGVKFFTPPFGYIDRETGDVIGFDIDILAAIAEKLGVELKLKPVTSENRIQLLLDRHIDIIAATMTRNKNRSKIIDFSRTYFLTSQAFLTKKGAVKELKDLEGKKIGTAKGSTSELNAKEAVPGGTIVTFEDYNQAAEALLKGDVDAVTTDEPILVDILMSLPEGQYDIPPIYISEEPYALGVRKGNADFLEIVNQTLLELDKSGEGEKIFAKWFLLEEVEKGKSDKAAGIVVRASSGVESRYLVMSMSGSFRKGAKVKIFDDSSGKLITTGTVSNIYTDEIYIDVEKSKSVAVRPGFPVGMNISREEAMDAIAEKQDVIQSVKQDIQKDKEALQQQIQQEAEADRARREKERDQYQQQRMRLDYGNNYRGRYYHRRYRGRYYYRY